MLAILNRIKRFLYKDKNRQSYKRNLFLNDYERFEKLNIDARFRSSKEDLYLCLDDNAQSTDFDAHYIYHPAWAARIVKQINPALHVDISSTLHFCSIISAFIKTEFYDYRPANLSLDNLSCGHADLVNLPFETGSLSSLSCMHTIEHIGLGRYGDPIDPDGDLKAVAELKRVCAPGGNLLIVVPIGVRRLQFNAHRIYAPDDMINYMNGFKLKTFSLINDDGNYIENVMANDADSQKYACGCYWFVKG